MAPRSRQQRNSRFKTRIMEQRQSLKMTRENLADEIRRQTGEIVAPSTIMRLEKGEMIVTMFYLDTISRAMKKSVADLLPMDMLNSSHEVPIRTVPVLGHLNRAASMKDGPTRRNLMGLRRVPFQSRETTLLAAESHDDILGGGDRRNAIVFWNYAQRKLAANKTYLFACNRRVIIGRIVIKSGKPFIFSDGAHVPVGDDMVVIGRLVAALENF